MEPLDLIAAQLKAFDLRFVAPYFLLLMAHFLTEPVRWSGYVKALQIPLPFATLFHVFNLSALLSLILPFKLGFPARLFLLQRTLKSALATIAGVAMVDALVYYSVWALFASIALALLPARVELANELVTAIWLLVAGVVLGVLVLRRRRSTSPREAPWTSRVRTAFKRARGDVARLGWAALALAIMLSASDVIIHAGFHWLLLALVGVDLPVTAIFIVSTLSMFAGFASMMPHGLGSYDVALVVLLLAFGAPTEAAIMIPVINRLGIFGLAVILGGVGGLNLGMNPFSSAWRRISPGES